MRVGRLDVVRHLDVGQLGAPDHLLLLLDGQRVPRVHVVHVLLHDDVAAAGEAGIGVADQGGHPGGAADRVLGAVDEAEQVALVEVAEPVHLVGHRGGAGQPGHDLAGELEAHVHPLVPDVKEQVALCGGSPVGSSGELAERMQLGRARSGEQPVPRARANPGHAGQRGLRDAEPDRPLQAGPVGEQVPDGFFPAGVDGQHHEDRGAGQRREHRLRLRLGERTGDRGHM